jgi:dihydroorotate dehydrogenase electron transfer subunit
VNLSDYPIEASLLRTVEIRDVFKESPLIKTFLFKDRLSSQANPGQFVMVWLPRIDEIPMSISSTSSSELASITVAKVGQATASLHAKSIGDIIGIRGPFGNSFSLVGGNVLLVGGGTGIAPLTFLADKLLPLGAQISFLGGAKTKAELIGLSKMEPAVSKTHGQFLTSTEDGSHGHKGVVTELVDDVLAHTKFDMIYTCGKEMMIYKIFSSAKKYGVPLQASLERLMRCAIGLCGSCTIGKYRVCVDGPVFNYDQLREVEAEFGRIKRGLDGRHLPI